ERTSGKLRWVREVSAKKIEVTHKFSNPAAPTPAADGQRVVFYFGSFGLLCFTHDGRELWHKELPPPVSRGNYGSAVSPVLLSDLVVLNLDTDQGGSRLLGVKGSTGDLVWETPRPLFSASWSTPALWTNGDRAEIIVLGSKKLVAYNATDGKELWSVPGFPLETTPRRALERNLVFACASGIGGRSGPTFDGFSWSDLMKLDQNQDHKLQKTEVPKDYKIVLRAELPEGHPGRLFPFALLDMF